MDYGLIYCLIVGYSLLNVLMAPFLWFPGGARWNSTAFFNPLLLLAPFGALKYFQGKTQNEAELAKQAEYNKYLDQHGQAFKDLVAKLQAKGFDPFGAQTSTGTTQGSTSGTTATDQTSTQQAMIRPEQQAMYDSLNRIVQAKLESPQQISESEKLQSVKGMMDRSGAARSRVSNAAARYGLSGQQVSGGMTPIEIGTASDVNRYLGEVVPGQERELANQAQGQAQGLIQAFTGQKGHTQGTSTTQGTTTGTSTQTTPPDMQSLFGMMAPLGPRSTGKTGFNPLASAGSDTIEALMKLLADNKRKEEDSQ